jgi:TPR repeat protein
MIPLRLLFWLNYYDHGCNGLHQDPAKAIELYARAADLGCIQAHHCLAGIYHEGGDLKKAKFHYEAAAMAGQERQEWPLDA